MSRLRPLMYLVALAALMTSVPPFIFTTAGQQRAASYTPARTPWGDPDLPGVLGVHKDVPFQRPLHLSNKAAVEAREEKVAYQRRIRMSQAGPIRPAAPDV